VKAFTRSACLALAIVGMLGVSGCGPDNETEGQKLTKDMGDPGPPGVVPKIERKATTTQAEHYEQSQAALAVQKAAMKGGGAPAPKK
jgi:hypothetical protein